MKVLLVTDQYIDIRSDGYYCNFALLGTLKNMSLIGDLYILASKPSSKKPAAQPINQKIEFIEENRVKHFRPLTSSIGEYLANNSYNHRILKEEIPFVDLVIGYAPGHNLDYALKIAKKYDKPFMTFLVSCPWDIMYYHQRWIVRLLAPYYYLKTKEIVRKSEYVHYVTNLFLQKKYPTKGKSIGCSDTNLGELRTAALSERFEKLSAKLPSDKVKILTIGHTDVRYKGHEYMIKAIAKFMKDGIYRYHYYLIGAGDGQYLKKICKQFDVESNVHFLGRKTHNEVMELLSDADIYVQPSLTEGLPRAVVEAMSTALPCIGFDTGGIPELLEPSFIVKRKDVDGIVRCIEALNDLELYKKIAQRNFNKAKEYEHTVLTAAIQDFFKQIRNDLKMKNN